MTSRDPRVIAGWFAATDHGVFLHVGRSGALVVDVDDPAAVPEAFWSAAELAGCPMQRTRKTGDGRRAHYVFAAPNGAFGNGRGGLSGCDVRGGNGVIVAQPSAHQHADGLYAWARHGAVPELPAELVALLAPRPAPSVVTAAASDGVAFADLSAGAQRARTAYLAGARGGELARLDRCTELSTPDGHGYTGEPWDETTHEVACALLDLADTPELPYSIADAAADVLVRAPRDAGFTEADHRAKLASAYVRASAGIGRVLPALLDSLDEWDLPTRDGAAAGPPMVDGEITVDDSDSQARVHLRDRLLSLTDLATMPPVVPLVGGLLYRGTLAQLAGPPGSYKSFLALAFACAVAIGKPWEGYRIPRAGVVVYVAAEGATGLRARILAWCEANGIDPADLDGRLFILPCAIQLGNRLDISEAVELVRHVGADLLVLDTRARCTIGLEENSATEQGEAIAAAEQIQQAVRCAVLAVHHTSRTGNAGRGSNAWDGAVWSDLRITGENLTATVHVEKHKDVAAGTAHHFRLMPHTVSEALMTGCDETQRNTLVIVQNDGWTNLDDSAQSIKVVLDVIRTSDGLEGLTRPEVVHLAEAHSVSRSSTYVAVKALVDNGSIRNIGSDKRARYVAASTWGTA